MPCLAFFNRLSSHSFFGKAKFFDGNDFSHRKAVMQLDNINIIGCQSCLAISEASRFTDSQLSM
jgi:hypothetical protein